MAEDGSAGVRSVNLALGILEAVGFADEELGVTQIATRLHVAKGSVHRHLYTLVERGLSGENPATSRYTIGPKSRLLARLAPDTDLIQLAEGPMRELRDAVGHSVVLSEMTPRGALVLAKLSSLCADRDRRPPRQRAAVPRLSAGSRAASLSRRIPSNNVFWRARSKRSPQRRSPQSSGSRKYCSR